MVNATLCISDICVAEYSHIVIIWPVNIVMRIVLGNISVISIYFAGFFFLILSKEAYLFIYYKIYFYVS